MLYAPWVPSGGGAGLPITVTPAEAGAQRNVERGV